MTENSCGDPQTNCAGTMNNGVCHSCCPHCPYRQCQPWPVNPWYPQPYYPPYPYYPHPWYPPYTFTYTPSTTISTGVWY
jgi:hypothetical protein